MMFRALKRPLKNKGGIQKKKEKADYFKNIFILPRKKIVTGSRRNDVIAEGGVSEADPETRESTIEPCCGGDP